MRRWLPVVLVVVVLVLLATLAIPWLLSPGQGADLVLLEVSGQVQVAGEQGDASPARAGQTIALEDRVTTGDGSSSAVIGAGPGVALSLSPRTDLRITGVDQDAVSVELAGGRVRAEVDRGGARSVQVGSRGRTVRTRDGTFTVAVADGVFAAQVERGTAQVEGVDGVDSIGAGGGVTALPDGSAARWTIPDEVFLGVDWPTERRTRAERVQVRGRTVPGARVDVRGGAEPVSTLSDADGRFQVTVELPEGDVPLQVEVLDAFGRVVSDAVRFEVDRTAPTLRGRVEETP